MARRVSDIAGAPVGIHTDTELTTALEGADVVLNAVRVGGLAARVFDESYPQRHRCPGEETMGPGGLANALRIAAINGGAHCNPAFAGDTFYAYSEVLGCWELPGRSDLGALRLRTLGIKNLESEKISDPMVEQEGKKRYRENVVLDLDYTVLMPRRS